MLIALFLSQRASSRKHSQSELPDVRCQDCFGTEQYPHMMPNGRRFPEPSSECGILHARRSCTIPPRYFDSATAVARSRFAGGSS